MKITLPATVPIRLSFDSERKLSEKQYLAFCYANPDLRVERTAGGEIVILPPVGGESAYRNTKVSAQLYGWAEADGRGKAFGSSVHVLLPDGSALSPDAAWLSNEAVRRLTPQQRREFPPLCPEFVVEVMSPSDRLKPAKAKMEQWIASGAQLGWLIDGDAKTVYIYRQGHRMRALHGITELAGEGPVEGFLLRLNAIWKGLA